MNTDNRDLSAVARSAKVDRLDESIDAVAARLTKVAEDDALAFRIVSSLPERRAGLTWMLSGWAPRLAMVAAIVAAGIVWGSRDQATTPHVDPLASTRIAPEPIGLLAAVREAEPIRTMRGEALEPLQPLESLEPSRVDFDRSLPSIETAASLEFDSLAPDVLPQSEGLVLESLVIADLPLTAEPNFPR